MNKLIDNMSQKTKDRLNAKYHLAKSLFNCYKEYSNDHAMLLEASRQLGNLFFDISSSVLDTSLWSDQLITEMNEEMRLGSIFSKAKLKLANKEHFYGRSAAGKQLLESYDQFPSLNDFCQFVIDYCSWHTTTKKENQNIKTAFTRGAKNWIEAYLNSNVSLYEVKLIKDGKRIVRIDKYKELKAVDLHNRFKK